MHLYSRSPVHDQDQVAAYLAHGSRLTEAVAQNNLSAHTREFSSHSHAQWQTLRQVNHWNQLKRKARTKLYTDTFSLYSVLHLYTEDRSFDRITHTWITVIIMDRDGSNCFFFLIIIIPM